MKYKAIGYSDSGGASIEISKERFEEVKQSKETCLFALELEEKFALLLDNYFEFESELLHLAEKARIWATRDHSDAMLRRLALDRRLVNLLTACRLYLDQTDHGISSLFGNPSDKLESVKEFKTNLYDEHWGYRFMEALRNHVQHSGLPVHVIGHNRQRVEGDGDPYEQFTVSPRARVATLRENKSFKKTVLNEMEDMGDEIDLRGPARQYVECFCKLHEFLRGTIAGKLGSDRSTFETAIAEFATIGGEEVRYPSFRVTNDDGSTVEDVALVERFLNYLDSFHLRNLINKNLAHSSAGNTDQKQA